jgi:SNF2 family DNA or RNA helicase
MLPLFEHQKRSIEFLRSKNYALDFSDPGTGKTRVQIELFSERRRAGGGCALVIAPKSLLRSAWADDFAKFSPGIKTVVATANNRESAFGSSADVYITNTDAVSWLAKKPASFFSKFDTLIVDELSNFKHRTSQRSKALNAIKKHFERRYGLTGTPNANNITDVWHQAYVVDNGESLGHSFFAFRSAVCVPKQVGPQPNMVQWIGKEGAEELVAGLLKDTVIRHKFEDCLDIPENFTSVVTYYPSKEQHSKYKNFERDQVALLDGNVVSAINAAVLANKLLQIASGAVYSTEGVYSNIDNGRYELIADLIESRGSVVVFFLWEHQRDLLKKALESRDISYGVIDGSICSRDRETAVKHFQAGITKVLLAHPASAAHGLTLTKGTTTIWASPTYNLEHFTQGNRRIYRAGQTQRTETIVVLAQGTLEDKVYTKLIEKDAKQISLLSILKELSNEKDRSGESAVDSGRDSGNQRTSAETEQEG